MTRIESWLREALGVSTVHLHQALASLAVVLTAIALRYVVLRFVFARRKDPRLQYRWRKATAYVAFLVAAILVVRIWFGGVPELATYFGLLSAGLAIALRDPLVNLAGWAFILWRRPFEVGDRIQIGAVAGDVIDVRIFQFSLMEIGNWVDADQSTGRVIHVPNGQIFVEVLANYTSGFRFVWNEIPVLVTFESDWRKAKKILEEIGARRSEEVSEMARRHLEEAAQRYLIFYSKLTPVVYTSVVDSGVLLTLRHLCEPRRRRGAAQEVWEDVLAAYAAHDDIDFAYPTRRLYDNALEGKPGLRPPGEDGS